MTGDSQRCLGLPTKRHLALLLLLTLAQCSVTGEADDKTNEIGAMPEILQNLVLEGRIITADAMHTQRETCQTIVDGGGDYVMIVNGSRVPPETS